MDGIAYASMVYERTMHVMNIQDIAHVQQFHVMVFHDILLDHSIIP